MSLKLLHICHICNPLWIPLEAQYGAYYSYNEAPRAQIFRRDHSFIQNITAMKRIMRFNDFEHDPLSRCNCTPPFDPGSAISARFDLGDPNGVYANPSMGFGVSGGIDGKVTNFAMFNQGLASIAISGPTSDQQPVFVLSQFNTILGQLHLPKIYAPGIPDRWDFPWINIEW